MEDLPGDVRVDARVVVEHLRAVVANATGSHPRTWVPQSTFDELQARADREPIHLHPALHHLHRRWDMTETRRPKSGTTLRARLERLAAQLIEQVLGAYFTEEQEFRAALARSIDAIAYRVDEIASADERNLLEFVRDDLLDLARFVEDRIDTRLRGPSAR